MFVPRSFLIFYRMSLRLQLENPEMSDDVVYSFDKIFTDILLSFVLFDVQNTVTTTPTKCVRVKHKCASNVFTFFPPLSIFTVIIGFYILFILFVAP